MARDRRPHTTLRTAAAATVLATMTVGISAVALAPAANATPTNSPNTSIACPPAQAASGPAKLAAGKPPKLRRDKILTVEDQAGSVNVLSNDGSSAGGLTLLAVTDPSHGTITWTPDGSVTYRPDNGYIGFDKFNYTAGDAAAQTATGGIVGVRICNVGATAEAVSLVGTFNHSVGFKWLDHSSAPAGDTISLWSFTQPAHGQTGVLGDRLVYLPDTGFSGTDHFTYTVSDGQGICSTAPVTVKIPVGTEVLPIPPIKRSPPPTLPDTGPAALGWLALSGLLLIVVGAAAMTASARLDRRRRDAAATAAARETTLELNPRARAGRHRHPPLIDRAVRRSRRLTTTRPPPPAAVGPPGRRRPVFAAVFA
jgi:hypothetical protein